MSIKIGMLFDNLFVRGDWAGREVRHDVDLDLALQQLEDAAHTHRLLRAVVGAYILKAIKFIFIFFNDLKGIKQKEDKKYVYFFAGHHKDRTV